MISLVRIILLLHKTEFATSRSGAAGTQRLSVQSRQRPFAFGPAVRAVPFNSPASRIRVRALRILPCRFVPAGGPGHLIAAPYPSCSSCQCLEFFRIGSAVVVGPSAQGA